MNEPQPRGLGGTEAAVIPIMFAALVSCFFVTVAGVVLTAVCGG